MRNLFYSSFILLLSSFVLTTNSVSAKEAVIYSHLTDGYWQIWAMDPDGSEQKQITFSAFDKREPVSVEQGSKILFRTNNGKLFTAGVDGADGGNETEIFPNFQNINSPRYCEATQEIVFVALNRSLPETTEIWKSKIDGADRIVLTNDKNFKYYPVFSPQGDKIAFIKISEDRSIHNIWLMNADGTNLHQLTRTKGLDASPDFSSDEKTLIFASNAENRDYDIYAMDIESGARKMVVTHPGLDTSPSFFSSGAKIVFVSTRSGSQQIWTANLDGSGVQQLTFGEAESIDPIVGLIADQERK